MIRKESIIENKRKRLMSFIATRLFGGKGRSRKLSFATISFTRWTRNGLNRDGWIAMVHRCRNNQAIRRVRRCSLRNRTGVKRLRNDMTRGLNPSRAKGTRDVRRGSRQRLSRNKHGLFGNLRD